MRQLRHTKGLRNAVDVLCAACDRMPPSSDFLPGSPERALMDRMRAAVEAYRAASERAARALQA